MRQVGSLARICNQMYGQQNIKFCLYTWHEGIWVSGCTVPIVLTLGTIKKSATGKPHALATSSLGKKIPQYSLKRRLGAKVSNETKHQLVLNTVNTNLRYTNSEHSVSQFFSHKEPKDLKGSFEPKWRSHD